MNKLKLFLLILFSQFLNSQSIIGAWEKYETNSDGSTHRHVVIFSEGFKSTSVFDSSNGKFISTNGGSWFLDGSTLTEKIEFDTQDQEKVGSTIKFEIDIKLLYEKGKIRAPIHLSGNNEKQLIKIFKKIKKDDWVISNWRSHYHALLHGMPIGLLKKRIMQGRSMGINSKRVFITRCVFI